MSQIPDRYDPSQVEERWYRAWEERGYFRADPASPKKPYCIVIPPPNVTGSLHLGHALDNTLQDILIRWKRMDGFNTLWMPGTDHAGIATQVVVERQLAEEGKTKDDLGREAFIRRVWQWKEASGGTIIRQLKRLGSSCDWARERFTMDPGLSAAVREVFVRLWEEGLVYRGDYIVNWCPRCQTVLSDLEVEHEERDAELYYIKYGSLTLATVRPETKLGDTALAVHPKDRRYARYVGQTLTVRSVEGEITMRVVADAAVDPKFGTGVVKVTPAHDPADFEIGKRHGLEVRQVIGFDARMNERAGKYAGLDRFECRKRIVEDMRALGLIEKVEPYRHSIGLCYRCKTVVEPLVSTQWYVRMKPLAEPAIKAVRAGKIKIVPRQWRKTYFQWMENIRDWCVSRQLWWGHRLPVWYCDRCRATHVSRVDLTACPDCRGPLRQDTDVLDTWFSSALWPFSTLGWPADTPELKTFYPTSCLVTGFDILFFWVARMIMMGLKFTGEVPFRDVYIHALLRDPEGKKMSKSRGNVIDPLEVMDRYGTDAFRFTLAALAAQGRDIRLAEERIEGYRNFANKLWNAARFVLANLEGYEPRLARKAEPTLAERWILSRLARTIGAVRKAVGAYRFNDAASAVYQFLWHEYCDWYLECAKLPLYRSPDLAARARTQRTCVEVLETTLRLLHPFMPFLTEEIWQRLPAQSAGARTRSAGAGPVSAGRGAVDSIMVAAFPRASRKAEDPDAESEMDLFMAIVTAVRNIRAEMRIQPATTLRVLLRPASREATDRLTPLVPLVEALARCEATVDPAASRPAASALAIVGPVECFVPLAGLVDLTAERQRLQKEIRKAEDEVRFLEAKLDRREFRERAPAEVVERETTRLTAQRTLRDKLLESVGRLDAAKHAG
ncbi:MAG: valine--tRNA ligase [Candidatus Rokubacteria bacterium]|nr:valine--tRNA ligase [Candidatus Rokubacteria bacterium]